MIDVSVVIPALHEYPQLIHTIFSIQNEFSDLNYSYEIIVVENGEEDEYTPQFLKYFRIPLAQGWLKYFFEPTPCGPAARMAGARKAEGKYIVFCDAHVEFGKNTIPLLIETMEHKDAGMVCGSTIKTHCRDRDKNKGSIPHHVGSHYELFVGGGPKLYSHFHGGYRKPGATEEPFLIAGGPLAYVVFNREEFLKLRGYHPACRFYPHPEGYLPLKYWMFDRECWAHPMAYHFHSNYPKGGMKTGYKTIEGLSIDIKGDPYRLVGGDHLIRNAMLTAYTLGGESWIQRIHDHWSKKVRSMYVLNGIRDNAILVAQEEREWILDNAHRTLDEVLENLHKMKVKGIERLE